jgi:hypothetical protein
MLRRVVYMGEILVPAEGEEPEVLREGIHEGIISEDLYYQVQMLLSRTKKKSNKPTRMQGLSLNKRSLVRFFPKISHLMESNVEPLF